MIKILYAKGGLSPAQISRHLKADRRTLDPMITVGINLGLIDCEKIVVSDREYRKISLTNDYRKVLGEKIN